MVLSLYGVVLTLEYLYNVKLQSDLTLRFFLHFVLLPCNFKLVLLRITFKLIN